MLCGLLVNGEYDLRQQLAKPSPAPIRPSNIFHGNPAYPTPPIPYAASMPPQLPNGIDRMSTHATVSTSTAMDTKNEDSSPSPDNKPERVVPHPGKPSEGKQQKYFNVEDPERSRHKVRVRLALHECHIHEVPDDYRKRNSVYPRSWFPTQMQLSPSSRGPRGRFLESRDDTELKDESETGTTLVTVPMLEGSEGELKVPGLGRMARKREDQLNDMGYRISWNQRKLFADRVLFLQQSLDVYRGKIRDGMKAQGQEIETTAPVYQTRVGKKRWVESRGKGRGKGARK